MSTENLSNISFDLPKNQSNVIKVIGVGGGGSNAINHMFKQGINGVDFVICNTDAQALENSPIPTKIQLGVNLTEGLGAGANPEIGEQAAVESFEDIKDLLSKNTKMVFITAGMGGGTGTGAAPIIAKQAREMDILTVGIVTVPFQFEGKTRNEQAQSGVEKLRENVDSLIVINNNKLREVYGNLGFKAGFSKADEVLATASRGIAEVITHHYTQNIDLRDAKTVLSNSGTAIMGSASASGTNRSKLAIEKALDSPLLNDNKITGAQNVLLLIVSGRDEITIDEIGEINDHIQNEAGNSANIIMGVGEDEELDDAISVTVIATGFNSEQQDDIVNTEAKKIIHTLEDEQKAEIDLTENEENFQDRSLGIDDESPQKQNKIVHQLEDIEEDDKQNSKAEENPLIDTTETIENIEVEAEYLEVDDFEITDKTEDKTEKNPDDDDQHLTFDLFQQDTKNVFEEQSPSTNQQPQKESQNPKIIFDLDEDIRSIEVNEPEEVKPESTQKVKTYQLEDPESENSQNKSKFDEDENLKFETKTKPQQTPTQDEEPKQVDPLNASITELKARAAERRAKMKQFNYRFSQNQNIDEIEKQPAYKRAGVELDDPKDKQGKLSRTTLHNDDDEITLRNNNSFLHDNVD
ncbi:cell division protein FtsZ [Mesohalobacter halotolerans]|uniref:Cell division protein FtsZ n=1 Tax=Mesohalobacter halotolerans TaxID=1883405 RepID=A0A4U5TTF1_9FLAO|nr:cell division protein FtsZ [Mesohalobacter halotolerans]TKS57650.1 cell division protein FtsZ [Mesohalobacter halotolerans]